jgi:hypothetical protein
LESPPQKAILRDLERVGMTREELQTIAKASPFRPFTLVTESSGQYSVEHPDYIHFPPLAEPDDPDAWPSYVEVYNRSSAPRYLTIATITEVIFKSLRE